MAGENPRSGGLFHATHALRMRTMLLVLIAVAVLPSLLVQVGYYQFSLRELHDQEMRSSKELSRLLAIGFEEYVRDLAQQEASMGAALMLKWPYSVEDMNALLKANAKDYAALDSFILIGLDGKVMAASKLQLIGVDVTRRGYFQKASTTRDFVLSDLQHGKLRDEPLFFVARGIYNADGRLEAVISAGVDPTRLDELTFGLARTQEGHLSLFDREGRLVYQCPKTPLDWSVRNNPETPEVLARALAGQEAQGIIQLTGEDREHVAVRVPAGKTGYVAGTSRPRSAVTGPLHQHMLVAGAVNVGVILLSIAAAFLISRVMARDVRRLQDHAVALGQGQADGDVVSGAILELNHLADALNEMAARRTQAEGDLKTTADELARSNRDLEQFAYVASHDLQEPLRMVTGHLQLIEDRLADRLDDESKESMNFAIDGATRMHAMIQDLLSFSRAGRRGQGFVRVETAQVFEQALGNLDALIEETKAQVTHDELPTVQAEPAQIGQVFQNLIGNAIKYGPRGRRAEVHVGARREDRGWVFWVRDNGIGIAAEHRERIFDVFQRLHTHQEYPGTGIGLAICKRIVESHCGRIWVESAPGQGSTFFFTIPDRD